MSNVETKAKLKWARLGAKWQKEFLLNPEASQAGSWLQKQEDT